MNRILAVAGVVLCRWSRRKEGYILAILMGLLLYGASALYPATSANASLYLLDIALMLTWLFGWIVALHAGATELPGEEERGTVFLLLAKPLNRAELIAGKWLGAWLASILCSLVFQSMALGAARLAGLTPPMDVLMQAGLLHLVSLGVLCAMALAFSTRFTRDASVSMAIVTALALYLLVPRIPQLAHYTDGWRAVAMDALYYGLPHLELFDLRRRVLHGFGPVSFPVLLELVAYGAVWTSVWVLVAWLSYRNRLFQRDRMLD